MVTARKQIEAIGARICAEEPKFRNRLAAANVEAGNRNLELKAQAYREERSKPWKPPQPAPKVAIEKPETAALTAKVAAEGKALREQNPGRYTEAQANTVIWNAHPEWKRQHHAPLLGRSPVKGFAEAPAEAPEEAESDPVAVLAELLASGASVSVTVPAKAEDVAAAARVEPATSREKKATSRKCSDYRKRMAERDAADFAFLIERGVPVALAARSIAETSALRLWR